MPFKACISMCWWKTLRHEHTHQTPVPLSTTTAATQSPYVEPTTLCGCFAGLITAYVSDTSLHDFVTANKKRQAAGQPKQQLLQNGEHPSMLLHQKDTPCIVAKHDKCPLAIFRQKAAHLFSRVPATLMCLHALMIFVTHGTSQSLYYTLTYICHRPCVAELLGCCFIFWHTLCTYQQLYLHMMITAITTPAAALLALVAHQQQFHNRVLLLNDMLGCCF